MWLDPVFVGASVVGYAGLVWIALAPPLALRAGAPLLPTTALVAASVWLTDLVTLGIKFAASRPRPFERLPEADPLLEATVGASFPSGHASTSVAGAIVLAYVARRAAPLLVALALLVLFSRVYVGVHYPLDVLAGAALGAVGGGTAVLAVRRLRPTSGGPRRSGPPPPGG